MTLALVLDIGTSNAKVGVVSPEGEVVARARRAIQPRRPERGAVEHDPEALWRTVTTLVAEVARPRRESIAVLGLSGYQFGFLPLDGAGAPLTGMMTLLDERPKRVMDRIRSELPVEEIYRRTGCPPLFPYGLSKLVWLKTEKPDLFARAERFADLKGFLLERLTGQFVTEPSIAAATQLLNLRARDWDDQILEWVGIDRSFLPEVVPGEEMLCELAPSAAGKLGVAPGTPVLPGLYDGGAMIFGMGGTSEDVAVCNLGTTAMVRGCADAPLLDDPAEMRLQTYPLTAGRWAVGGALNNAGIALQWYRDAFATGVSYEALTARAEQVPPGSGGLFCLPFLTGERDPRIGNRASGSFFGVREFHTEAHLTRSILEGVAYGLRMIRDALAENGVRPGRLRIGGSGARSDLWPQIVADVLDVLVERSRTPDATLVGEALLAFTALGTYDDLDDAAERMVRVGKSFSPSDPAVETYEEAYDFFRGLVAAMAEVYPRHAQLFSGEESG